MENKCKVSIKKKGTKHIMNVKGNCDNKNPNAYVDKTIEIDDLNFSTEEHGI